jgi:hypothetical protein
MALARQAYARRDSRGIRSQRSDEATMDALDKLSAELAWQRDGHVTDVALTAVADGELAILPEDVLHHIEACDHCTTRLGAEALLSAQAGEMMAALVMPNHSRSLAKARPPEPQRVAPKAAIVLALVVAGLGAVPALLDAVPRLPEVIPTIVWAVPLLARSAIAVMKSDVFPVLVWLSALVLVLAGVLVSRMRPLPRSFQQQEEQEEGGV